MAASPLPPHAAPPLRSVYFGGGTPSLTPPPLLARLMATLRERYGLADDCEVTLEMDPGTFDAERLRAYLDALASPHPAAQQPHGGAVVVTAVEGRRTQLQRLLPAGHTVRVLSATHSLHDHPRVAVALANARRTETVRELDARLRRALVVDDRRRQRRGAAASAASTNDGIAAPGARI